MVSTTSSPRSATVRTPIMTPHNVLNAWVRALTALARVTRSVRITSTVPDLAFGMRGLAQDGAGDLLGIEAVGFAVHAAGQPTWPVHLHDPLAGLGQCSGQGGTERSGAFDTDRCDLTVSAHPGQQPVVAAVGGGELLVSEQPALLVEYGCVVGVLVGVETADDSDCFGCHTGIRAPIRSDPSGRCAPRRCTRAGRQWNEGRDGHTLCRGQTDPVQRRAKSSQIFPGFAGGWDGRALLGDAQAREQYSKQLRPPVKREV